MRRSALVLRLLAVSCACRSAAGDESCAAGQESDDVQALVLQAKVAFDERFGAGSSSQPGVAVTFAPGRVNLIGEHTDYSDGFVLPMATEQGTVAVGRVSADGVWRASSTADAGTEPPAGFEVPSLVPNPGAAGAGWVRYVQGVAAGYDDVVRAAAAPARCA